MTVRKTISIVMPAYNEEKGIPVLYGQLVKIINSLNYDFNMIFVNDGSSDNTLQVLSMLHEQDARVKIINLSRNFGHQNALTAGINNATGDAIILMDVDLEDNPKYIIPFIENWEKGYNVVFAQRGRRKVGFLKKGLFTLFHKINSRITDINMEPAGIFSLMDRSVVDSLISLPEKNRYIPGLRKWVGLRQIGIEVDRDQRYDGTPRVKPLALFKLAFDSFVSFSTVPLQLSMLIGSIFSALSFLGIAVVVTLKFTMKLPVQGWASTICIILLIGGIQLICIGLQGEYISRIFNEVKNRPNYLINNRIGFEENG